MIRTAVVGGRWLVTPSPVDLLLVGLGRCQTTIDVPCQRRVCLLNLMDGLGRIGHAIHGSRSIDCLRRRQRGLVVVLVGILYILVGVLRMVRMNRRSVQSLGLWWVGGMEGRVAIIGKR